MGDIFDQASSSGDIFDQAANSHVMAPPDFHPKVPDPISGLQGEGDMSGLTVAAPPNFSTKVGDRIQQNINLVPNLIDAIKRERAGKPPTPKDIELRSQAEAVGKMAWDTSKSTWDNVKNIPNFLPALVQQMGEGYIKDPSSLVGDIATAGISHEAMGGSATEGKQTAKSINRAIVPEPPSKTMTELSPEQQAKFTADIDKANADYASKAADYHSKISQLFDESKRQAMEAQKQYESSTAEARQAHQTALDKAQSDLADEVAKESKSQAEWQAKADAAKASQDMAAKIDEQRKTLAATQDALTENVRQGAQKVYAAARANLDSQWDAVRQKVGEDSGVPIKNIVDSANDAIKEHLRGSPGNIKQFKELLKEFGMTDVMENEDGSLTATPDATSSWQTLRTHSSALGRALSAGDLPGNIYQALKQVRGAIEDSLEDVAESRGAGKDYRAVKSGERNFQNDFESLGSVALGEGTPLSRLVRAPSSTFAADQIHGKAGDILVKNLNKWDSTGQLGKAVETARNIKSQIKSLPNVKAIPDPAPYEGKTPQLRQVAPPDMPDEPAIPERKNIPEPPSLQAVKKPAPDTSAADAAKIKTARRVGKVAGLGGGLLLGRPITGYHVGGEVAAEIARRSVNRPVAPPPPTTP